MIEDLSWYNHHAIDSQNLSGHILLAPFPAQGHVGPIIVLASKIVQERPDIVVTLVTVGKFNEVVEKEVPKLFSGTKALISNIRYVNLGGQGSNPLKLMPLIYQGFPKLYQDLVNVKPIQCLASGKVYDAVLKPTAAIVDLYLYGLQNIIRSITDRSVPVFVWSSGSTSAAIRLFGPSELGGIGNMAEKIRIEAERTGKKPEDIGNEMFRPAAGDVVRVAGLPPMYDYEFYPQEESPDLPIYLMYKTTYAFFSECDGIVGNAAAAYEQASIDAFRTWLSQTNRKYTFYATGPLLPPGFGGKGLSKVAKQGEINPSDNAREFESFLDGVLAQHGENSLVYVSFGSTWWPKNEYAWAFVDILLDLKIPFILSHASPIAVAPPGFVEKIKKSGLGLLAKWCPQLTILDHPATGWFVTHCGNNSVIEALAQGIPMIAWPLMGDQSANASALSLVHDVAFELVEVRTGRGLRPLYRGVTPSGTTEAVKSEALDVFQRARGEEGARKRKNANILKDKMREAWEEGGDALENIRSFLNAVSS